MRKVKLQMQVSVDGFNSTGANDEQKWVSWAWDEIKQDVLDLTNSCDTELIGRKLALDYLPFWTETFSQPESIMYEVAKVKAGQKKIVFTRTMDKSIWENTALATGDLREEINTLKEKTGKDMIVYGGSCFVAELVKESLIDEFYLFVNPIALGKGVAIFDKLQAWQALKLIKAKLYDCSIILLHYQRL